MSSGFKFHISYSEADAKRVLFFLLGLDMFFVMSYCLVRIILPEFRWGPIPVLLDVDRETSIPTWFSSLQLFAVGLLLILIARSAKQLKAYLFLLGLGFMFLSMDETAAVHEKITDSARRLNLEWLLPLTFTGNHGAWIIPYIVIGLALVLVGYRPLFLIWSNFRREAMFVAIGMALFGIGGIGLEILSFYFESASPDKAYLWAVAGEEFFEMAGVSVVLYAFMLLGVKIQNKSVTK
ncbi:MAG: hypothetical protein ACREQW_04560 [Candidatus Binatia bacterium]